MIKSFAWRSFQTDWNDFKQLQTLNYLEQIQIFRTISSMNRQEFDDEFVVSHVKLYLTKEARSFTWGNNSAYGGFCRVSSDRIPTFHPRRSGKTRGYRWFSAAVSIQPYVPRFPQNVVWNIVGSCLDGGATGRLRQVVIVLIAAKIKRFRASREPRIEGAFEHDVRCVKTSVCFTD